MIWLWLWRFAPAMRPRLSLRSLGRHGLTRSTQLLHRDGQPQAFYDIRRCEARTPATGTAATDADARKRCRISIIHFGSPSGCSPQLRLHLCLRLPRHGEHGHGASDRRDSLSLRCPAVTVTPKYFDRGLWVRFVSGWACCLTRRSSRDRALPFATLCLAKFRTRFVRVGT